MPHSAIRVVIGDDSLVFTRGLTDILEDSGDIAVVEVARDRDTLLTAAMSQRPDVLVSDLRMPPTFTEEGLDVIRRARAAQPSMAVLLFSQFAVPSVADQLLATGDRGVGYLLKDRVAHPGDLVQSVRAVAAGGTAIDPALVQALLSTAEKAGDDPLAPLTRSERDVLRLLAEGCSNDGIAERLSIGRSAVEKHVTAVFRKLPLGDERGGANRRVQATLYYLANCGSAEVLQG